MPPDLWRHQLLGIAQLEFPTATFLTGRRSGSDESIQIHGRAEDVYRQERQ